MKTIVIIIGLLTAAFTLKVNGQHEHHNMDHSSLDHGDMVMKHDVDKAFREQLASVMTANQKLNDAFVTGEAEDVKNAIENVTTTLTAVDMKLLSGEAHMDWMNQSKVLKSQIEAMKSASSIEDQRKVFITYNETLYKSVKAFGTEDQTVFYQYCPMANGGKGATWLSLIQEIKNPYLGQKMLTCGSVKETIQ
ncbi:Protein of unknown function (DUF3347) [Belliella baltica DSM 15883]|uniref:DUF3347 domain-containing protein n=1 Tax=Belliella baltica (strain DSM 15883 / CIP 108006 / LMG 21964 / BA134) TaxID=866536 RepID=I3Z3U2_BELBD|nr:DUF3347 domain-containing protein [Belliella baltica]AFL83910.1 Protein of unknown function (DUF3347) [Belliella baltica DSM 15883]